MNHHDHEPDLFDLGLQADLGMLSRRPVDRRKALRLGLAGIGALLAGSRLLETASAAAACVPAIPPETGGPFPGDGSNGPNALARSGIVRSDIRPSLQSKNVAQGVPTTLELTLVDAKCNPLVGYAVYVWHCSREGLYSMYSQGATGEDYLRGVQATDKTGKATFKTVFPACYPGRWPHVHFEIYPSLAKATAASDLVHTSQLALPKAACDAVYSSAPGYAPSVRNLARLSLATDMVFRDGAEAQLATVTGSLAGGYRVALTVGVPG